MILLYYEVKV